MYIPEFFVGFAVGFVIATIIIVGVALRVTKKSEDKEIELFPETRNGGDEK